MSNYEDIHEDVDLDYKTSFTASRVSNLSQYNTIGILSTQYGYNNVIYYKKTNTVLIIQIFVRYLQMFIHFSSKHFWH